MCAYNLTGCITNGFHSKITPSFNTLTLQLCHNIIFTLATCRWPEICLSSPHCGHSHTNTSSQSCRHVEGAFWSMALPDMPSFITLAAAMAPVPSCYSLGRPWRTLLLTPLNRAALLAFSPPHTEMWGLTPDINSNSLFLQIYAAEWMCFFIVIKALSVSGDY